MNIRAKKDNTGSNPDNDTNHSGLEKRQKVLSVVFMVYSAYFTVMWHHQMIIRKCIDQVRLCFQVVLPYLKSKLHSMYNKEREARLQASLWGDESEEFDVNRNFVEEDSQVSRETLDADASIRILIRKRLQKIVGFCYPWLHASSEGKYYSTIIHLYLN